MSAIDAFQLGIVTGGMAVIVGITIGRYVASKVCA